MLMYCRSDHLAKQTMLPVCILHDTVSSYSNFPLYLILVIVQVSKFSITLLLHRSFAVEHFSRYRMDCDLFSTFLAFSTLLLSVCM